jgi:hypothetical protein
MNTVVRSIPYSALLLRVHHPIEPNYIVPTFICLLSVFRLGQSVDSIFFRSDKVRRQLAILSVFDRSLLLLGAEF